MKKVLITGDSGYIGSHLTQLISKYYHVFGLDVKEPQVPVDQHFTVDINNLPDISIEFDAVVHLAALVNVNESVKIPTSYYQTNLNGTLNLLNKIKYKNFIFASTGAAEFCHSPYGTSKRAAEDCILQNLQGKDFTIFRFYNVIGKDGINPTNPDGLMYNLIKSRMSGQFTIHGHDYTESPDGTCVRDYVHVNEICHGLKMAIEEPSRSIECLGHGKGYTVKQIVEKFQEVNYCKFDINYGPRREGDLPVSVLGNVSRYMKNLYSMDDLLKV